jgi:anthranilate synthase component 2
LGHQAIVEHFGGEITRAATVMHGKASNITHCGDKMFSAMPQPMAVARYHSLMAQNLPESLSVLAQYEDVPMAVYHDTANMLGFQFHPESILTSDGSALLKASIAFLVQRGESYES